MLNDVKDLLVEIGSEELPSSAVKPLVDALADNLVAALAKANLTHGKVSRFATPRRLAVLIHDVQVMQASQSISRRGPANAAAINAEGQPTQALLGFAKSCGVSVDQLATIKTDKGDWWVYESTQPGAKTADLLPMMLNDAIASLPIAKPMRWGAGDTEFARPVHWTVLLFGDDVIPAQILGVNTGRQSVGHRYHHPEALTITTPREYEAQLQDAFVVADFDHRRQTIIEQIQQLTISQDMVAVMPDALLDEVTSIVEWPNALLVGFEQTFLDVPAEALIAAMQSHQKCFALRDKQNNLLPQFITVANIVSTQPQQVIAGNESVMRARLSDAAFFFHLDKKQPLFHHRAATEKVLFQQKLGSLADKATRMEAFLACFTESLSIDSTEAKRAAELSKCDLMTGMVGEFPELQGLMGYYYALNDGEPIAVAKALNEQYMPRFAADSLPQSNLGTALSLADRLDTLVGAFAINQKPTGTKDPFKLRRHALAVVRLLEAIPAPLSLSTLIEKTRQTYGIGLTVNEQTLAELKPFILERMQSFYQTQGVTSDLVHAVRARQDDCLFDLDKRVKALQDFVRLPDAQALSAACKRVNNLLQHASVKFDNQAIDLTQLKEPAEKAMLERILAVEEAVAPYYGSGDYGFILSQLASLRESVDAFFEHVMVMVDDLALRQNRLHLLGKLQQLLQGVADISLLVGASGARPFL